LTNKPENILNSGVIHLGISDHSMIFAVKSITVPTSGRHTTREIRDYKKIVESDFIEEILQLPWDIVCQFDDPNVSWQAWKSIFLEILDRHAPIRCKRTRGTSVPWITSNVKRLMRNRDFHKEQARKHAASAHWDKIERNRVNVATRSAKKCTFVTKSRNAHRVGMLKRSGI
jgi:hypothetical protein